MKLPLFGAHMPTTGGPAFAITSGHEIQCDAVQLFSSSPRQWRGTVLKPEAIEAFQEAVKNTGIGKTISHDSYLINLAAPVGSEILEKSHAAFRGEIERAEQLGLDFVVSHPGSHGGDGYDVGLERLSAALDKIHEETAGAKVRVALETTAGQGTYLGGRFEHLRTILDKVKDPDRLAVCMDTCHVFTAGYDIRNEEVYEQTMEEFDKVIGLKWLQVIHANDSAKPFASHLDRHAHIGEGEIGIEAFRLLVNDKRIAGLPIIVETPESEEMHKVNVAKLRSLVQA